MSRDSSGLMANQKERNTAEMNQAALPQIELPPSVTVKQLADSLKVEPVKVIKQLMRRGIIANINQPIVSQEGSRGQITSPSSNSYRDGTC